MSTMAEAGAPIDRRSMAVTFGPPERALCGWYHPPRGTPRNVAVLLCSSVGWEGLAMQPTYRALAECLSAAGFGTLRFDLDGTGDSAGQDEDPERVEAWRLSIALAAAQLRLLTGLERLSLVGTHLGGTLAAEFAVTDSGVASAVLWAPVVRGKQLVREIHAYAALNGGEPSGGDLDAAGFRYRADTLDALASLDLAKLHPPARRVLLLPKTAGPTEEALAVAWRERGAEVSGDVVAGYDDMMQESRKSQIPVALIERVVGWLSSQHPAHFRPILEAPPSDSLPTSGVRGPYFQEEPFFFGPSAEFFGILTRATPSDRDRPTVVFLNTSDDHHIGPNRLFVPLSRQLARSGLSSFRFDPTGIGEHRGPPSDDPAQCYAEVRLLDTTVVLDFLESQGPSTRFILMGLCSGAYVAFHAALNDDRVVGTVLVNPLTFIWHPGDSLDARIRASFESPLYRRTIRRIVTWTGQAKTLETWRQLVSRGRVQASRMADRLIPSRGMREFRIDRGFKALLDRGTRVLLVFGDVDERLNVFGSHMEPDGGYLRRDPRFHFELLQGADHTFTRGQDRQNLFALVQDFVCH